MNSFQLPYAQTISVPYVARDASIHRAIRLSMDTDHKTRINRIGQLIQSASTRGLTWKELSDMTGLHHGQVSGILSKLHDEGVIFALKIMRDRCHPYCHKMWSHYFDDQDRVDRPATTKAKRNRELLDQCRGLAKVLQHEDSSTIAFQIALSELISLLIHED